MTSNTTEYQREYQRQYRKTHPQKQYKKVKIKVKKQVKNKMLEIALERLKPPRAPVKVETLDVSVINETLQRDAIKVVKPQPNSKTIDFSYLTNNSSFQRAIMEFMKKYAPGLDKIKVRGSKSELLSSFDRNRRDLMKELKTVLEARKK